MNAFRIRCLSLGILLGAPIAPRAAAQLPVPPSGADTAQARLEPIVVRGATAPATVGGVGAVVVAVDSLRLPPSGLFDEAVARLPFIHVRGNSRGESEIAMRGSESRQVAVFVDGVPITLAWDHRADLSLVPLTGVERIVLVRGVSSLLYGPNALGGIVDVTLAGPQAASAGGSLRMRSSVDEFGGHAVSVTGATPFDLPGGRLLVRAGAGHRSRDGFAGARGVADPAAPRDESWFGDRALRTNSDLAHRDAFATLTYRRPTGTWLGLTTMGFRAERGVTPELHTGSPRFWRYPSVTRGLAVFSGGTAPRATPLGAGALRGSLAYDRGSFSIDSYDSDAYATITGTEAGDDRTASGRVVATHTLADRGELRVGFTGADVLHDERLDGSARSRFRQRLWSLGTETDVHVGATGQLSGGVAYDAATTPETGGRPPLGRLAQWGARLGGSVAAMDGAVRLHLSASRRARFPSLRELYSTALDRFEANPALAPETLDALEAGATLQGGALALQGVAFHHRLTDAIARVRLSDPTRFKRINRDEVRTTGVELLGGWAGPRFSLDADVTVQHIAVLDPSSPEGERRAEHLPAVEGSLRASVSLPLATRALVFGRYTGRQYCVNPDVAGRYDSLAGTVRADAGIEREWRLGRGAGAALLRILRLSATVDNVADAVSYSQCGLPEPGRTLRIGLGVG